jgi:D-alanine-D-alanine ligase
VKIGLTFTARTLNQTKGNIGASNSAMNESANGWPGQACDDAEEEFDSHETIEAIAGALTSYGHEVELLADGQSLVSRLLKGKLPDFVFNIAEGRDVSRSREAWVPALLEQFGVPYSGSDPLTLCATLDKDVAKRLVREAGVAVPESVFINLSPTEYSAELTSLPLPVIVKPAFEGSSKGIGTSSVVDDFGQLDQVVMNCVTAYCQPVVVEQFINGDELTVGILGNSPAAVIGIMRVVPLENEGRFVYGLDVKRDWRRRVRYEVPAQLSPAEEAIVHDSALRTYHALGCRDVARLDFRLREGVPYFIDARRQRFSIAGGRSRNWIP